MDSWLSHMPKGMMLKSDGFASSLYDPDSAYTLHRFCTERGIPYADTGIPVSAYGIPRSAQKRCRVYALSGSYRLEAKPSDLSIMPLGMCDSQLSMGRPKIR